AGRRAVCERVRELAASGVAVLLASSDLAAVEQVAARVFVMRDGRLVREAPTSALLRERVLEILLDAPPAAPPPGFRLTPTDSRPTWARAVRRRRSPCAASTASRCARRACGFARWRTRCSTRRVTARVDAPAGGFYVSAVTLALHNTLTRRLEPFQPLAPPRVTLYTCGPTVWNYAHIGNFRTFLFEDLLRRYLEYSWYEGFHMMNLMDVDDRTLKAARAAGNRLADHTEPFVRAFFEVRDFLRTNPAYVYPTAASVSRRSTSTAAAWT